MIVYFDAMSKKLTCYPSKRSCRNQHSPDAAMLPRNMSFRMQIKIDISVPKQFPVSVLENLVSEKSLGFGFGKLPLGKNKKKQERN